MTFQILFWKQGSRKQGTLIIILTFQFFSFLFSFFGTVHIFFIGTVHFVITFFSLLLFMIFFLDVEQKLKYNMEFEERKKMKQRLQE